MRFYLSTLPSNTTSQLDVLWHNGHSLGVDGAQVCVFEQSHQVSLTGFLKSPNCCRLEPEISFEVLGDFSYETLEG